MTATATIVANTTVQAPDADLRLRFWQELTYEPARGGGRPKNSKYIQAYSELSGRQRGVYFRYLTPFKTKREYTNFCQAMRNRAQQDGLTISLRSERTAEGAISACIRLSTK